ncbi:MAG: AmmeMemoRadiSam system protein B [Spirochaetia bacterium]|nr:AmmeMemoRadiSam system protein B [Spirochaetia bacterium]
MIIQKPIGDAVFYPADPATLHSHVVTSMTTSQSGIQKITALPLAVISPHAAYAEVSEIMGKMYAELKNINPKNIVIIAPLHGDILTEDADYTLFFPEAEAFSMPGFTIPIDQITLQEIDRTSDSAAMRNSYFEEEPAIELQLPYIRQLFGEHSVIPLLVGNPSSETSRELSKTLRIFKPEETLFVVSTNLTGDLPSARAQIHAETAADILTGKDPSPLLEALGKKRISMCGAHILEAVKKTGYFTGIWTVIGYHKSELESANRSTYSLSAVLSPKSTEGIIAND